MGRWAPYRAARQPPRANPQVSANLASRLFGKFQLVREDRVLFVRHGRKDMDPRAALRERAAGVAVEIALGGAFAARRFGNQRAGQAGLFEGVGLGIDRGLQV